MAHTEVEQKLLKEFRELTEEKREAESHARRCGTRLDAIREIFEASKFKYAPGRFAILHEYVATTPRISKANIISVRDEDFYNELMDDIHADCGGEKLNCDVVLTSTAKIATPQRFRFKKKKGRK